MKRKKGLHKRMKENYEDRAQTYLLRRTPVILRFDGVAFHTFTKGMKLPNDELFKRAMNQTMLDLCRNIQGCVFGFSQSDEITLVLTDYKKLNTDAWLDYSVQKMCSIGASMATLYFNINLMKEVEALKDGEDLDFYSSKLFKATFDCHCFNMPKEEVVNSLIWRQEDATRNAISALGQAHFKQSDLHKKNGNQVQDMLMKQKGVNFNNEPIYYKRGACATRGEEGWVLDLKCPVFTKDNEYIARYI